MSMALELFFEMVQSRCFFIKGLVSSCSFKVPMKFMQAASDQSFNARELLSRKIDGDEFYAPRYLIFICLSNLLIVDMYSLCNTIRLLFTP